MEKGVLLHYLSDRQDTHMRQTAGLTNEMISESRSAGVPGTVTLWVIRLLSLFAFMASGYFSLQTDTGGIIGCGFSHLVDCEHVLNSRWAKWFSLPVSFGGLVVYGGMFVASLAAGRRFSARAHRIVWCVLLVLSVAAAGSAAWFICIQVFLLHSLCVWCMAVHTCGLALAACILVFGPLEFRHRRRGASDDLSRQSLDLQSIEQQNVIPSDIDDGRRLDRPLTHWLAAAGASVTALLIVGQLVTSQGMVVDLPDAPAETGILAESDLPLSRPDKQPPTATIADDATGASQPESPTEDEPIRSGSEESPDPQVAVVDTPAEGLRQPPLDDPPLDGQQPETSFTSAATPDAGRASSASDETLAESVSPPTETVTPIALEPEIDEEDVPPAEPLVPLKWNRKLSILDGRDRLDLDRHMVTGKIGAEFLVVALFDYTCSHCRHMHGVLDLARKRYGDQLAIVHVPVPMNTACNPYVRRTAPEHRDACRMARLGLAVWRAKPSAFAEYDDWMFESYQSRSYEEARRRAAELVGAGELNRALTDPWIHRHLRRSTQVFKETGGTGLPVVLIGRRTAKGKAETVAKSAAILFQAMENELGIVPQVPAADGR